MIDAQNYSILVHINEDIVVSGNLSNLHGDMESRSPHEGDRLSKFWTMNAWLII